MSKAKNQEVIDLCSSDEEESKPSACSASVGASVTATSSSSTSSRRRKLEVISVAEEAAITNKAEVRSQTTGLSSPLIFISSEDGGDSCIVTEGLMDLFKQQRFPNTVTCLDSSSSGLSENEQLTLRHIQQNDRFSCGYRNMQMMLTAVAPLLPLHHSFFERSVPYTRDAGYISLPNMKQLQQSMEQAWAAGFDPKGAQFYRNRIVGKTLQIGAVEVSYVLLFLGIDCSVVQFVECPESRSQLGPFCAAYFSKRYHRHCRHCNSTGSSGSLDISRLILQNLSPQNGINAAPPVCQCHCSFPLYLQYEGHSVTVVGVETFAKSERIKNLLLFDPALSGTRLRSALGQNDIKPFRRPLSSLEKKDCQIILASTKSLSEMELQLLKSANAHVLSAAESAILRALT